MGGRYDVIVIGVGTMGSSVAHELARRGARVLGLEQFDVPHAMGAHHGHSRMIRLAYYEHPHYVTLLKRAYELWRQLGESSGEQLLTCTGGVYLGRPDGELVGGSLRAAREHGLEHELLDRDALDRRYPCFRVPEDFVGFVEPQAGFVAPQRSVAVLASAAMAHGAELHGREPVLDVSFKRGGVSVRTGRDRYDADQVIFCGGVWTDRLVCDLGGALTVTRQVMGWVWPRDPGAFALGRFPVWAIDPSTPGGFGGIYYGFPMLAHNPGLKIARHHPATPTNPDTVERGPIDGDEEQFRPALRQYLSDADGSLLAIRVCLYTNSPDGHFIIDRHPRHDRAIVACGFSGHGFKFAPVVGQILADLALNGDSELPVEFLRLSRFG